MIRRAVLGGAASRVAGSLAGIRAAAAPQFAAVAATRRFASVVVQKDVIEYEFPRENPADGLSYELNWSLCRFGVVPQGKSFRNLKAAELSKAGGSLKKDAPKSVAWSKELETEFKTALGAEKATRYVQDCALGALAANEVPVRMITDSPAAALAFHTLCSRTKALPTPEVELGLSVLHISSLGSHGSEIMVNPKTKQIFMIGSFNAGALVEKLAEVSTDSFLERGVLPLWGPGDAGGTVYASAVAAAGAKVKHGCAISPAGFCRLFMGSAKSDGGVQDEYKLLPNKLDAPKAIVMFADDASATIPAASKLTPAQAAFYFAAACAPKGTTAFGPAAEAILAAGKSSDFYMINRGAFSSPAAAEAAAAKVAGKSGSASGPLGLAAIKVEGGDKTADAAAAAAAAKAFVASVGGRCKGMDEVLAAGPKVEEEKK